MLLKVQRTAFGGEADLVRPQPTASQPARTAVRAMGAGTPHSPRGTPAPPGQAQGTERAPPPARLLVGCTIQATVSDEKKEQMKQGPPNQPLTCCSRPRSGPPSPESRNPGGGAPRPSAPAPLPSAATALARRTPAVQGGGVPAGVGVGGGPAQPRHHATQPLRLQQRQHLPAAPL